eukprot:CAMPEP_0168565048 /NCGR_PEP_ID=MMETSP0413-20121227/13596_1 /TAXON_ID=136452 /ORGANISM="Filamoeba nolandi, Strain NC-AS-23-1" /LENGTH=130 /DNA_ID=CAMNT_0008596811 /DNA_START=198 /DNA_END=587 /DNA_ORIENTATION=-
MIETWMKQKHATIGKMKSVLTEIDNYSALRLLNIMLQQPLEFDIEDNPDSNNANDKVFRKYGWFGLMLFWSAVVSFSYGASLKLYWYWTYHEGNGEENYITLDGKRFDEHFLLLGTETNDYFIAVRAVMW